MEKNYEEMLDEAYSRLPKKALEHERFEIPRVESFIQGSKTIVPGFSGLIKDIRRDEKHLLKYLTKETATSITKANNQLTINGKVGAIQLNKLIENYFNQFVLCPECKKPDTKIISERETKILKCEACGALSPVKGI
ncbi:MAG: translation initiation factor IF-2 subunit beta [archaeon]|jgi:translation initiation factor 2 subunit 2